jgi:CheY-like chemotaxis protein
LPHVYVLDADPAFLEVAADLLVEANVRATLELMSGRSGEVLGRLRAARPDLVVVDVAPHHGDAGGLLAAMAGAGTLAAIPILLASTNPPSAQRLAQAHAALVRAILPKPFDLDDFFAVLRRLLALA